MRAIDVSWVVGSHARGTFGGSGAASDHLLDQPVGNAHGNGDRATTSPSLATRLRLRWWGALDQASPQLLCSVQIDAPRLGIGHDNAVRLLGLLE